MKLIEGGGEEVVEVEAVGLAVVGVEVGVTGELAKEMQFKVSGAVGSYVSVAGGAHKVQGGAESIGVAGINVVKT